MAFPAVTAPSNANLRTGTFQAIYIRPAGGKFQTLGSITKASLDFGNITNPDSMKRNKSNNAGSFSAKCTMRQASGVELALVPSIMDGTNSFLFKMSDAAAIPVTTEAATVGWFLVSASQVGAKAKPVFDGTIDNEQAIELEIDGSYQMSVSDAIAKALIADVDFESSTDTGTYHAIGTYTAAKDGGNPTNSHVKSAGVLSITLADTIGGGAQSIGPINNVKFSFTPDSEVDGAKRPLPSSFDIALDFDWLQNDAPDLLLLDAMSLLDVNVAVSMLAGTNITLTNQTGHAEKVTSPDDYDKKRTIGFSLKGSILISSFAAMIS